MTTNKKIKILLIEDETEIAEMYKEKFEESGFKIVLAFDAEQAMQKAKKEKPDLVLLDILLPTENGISFLAKMRKEPEIKNTLVIALSNYDEPRTKQEAFDLKVKDYLLKTDYTPKTLVEKIRKYLPST